MELFYVRRIIPIVLVATVAFTTFLPASKVLGQTQVVTSSQLTGIALPTHSGPVFKITDAQARNTFVEQIEAKAPPGQRLMDNPEMLLWTGEPYRRQHAPQILQNIVEALKTAGYTYTQGESSAADGAEQMLIALQKENREVLGLWVVSDDLAMLVWGERGEAPATPVAVAADSAVLVAGEPPLTQPMVNRFVGFFEWLFEAPLTHAQRRQLHDALLDTWKNRRQDDIKSTLELLQVDAQIAGMTPQQRELVVRQAQPEILTALRAEPDDPINQWLLGIYDAAHKPLIATEPRLTRQMTDAYAEVLFFMLGEVMGESFAPDKGVKDAWAKSIAADWDKFPAAHKKEITQMPLTWAALRAAWPDIPDAQKTEYRALWTQRFRQMLPQAPIPAKAATPVKPAGSTPAPDADKRTPQQLMNDIMQQQQTYTALSNMSMQMHYSNINAMNTLAGNPMRYTDAYGRTY